VPSIVCASCRERLSFDTDVPARCPKCKGTYWETEEPYPTEVSCFCARCWEETRVYGAPPDQCPNCAAEDPCWWPQRLSYPDKRFLRGLKIGLLDVHEEWR
jgi:hypothetical protein